MLAAILIAIVLYVDVKATMRAIRLARIKRRRALREARYLHSLAPVRRKARNHAPGAMREVSL